MIHIHLDIHMYIDVHLHIHVTVGVALHPRVSVVGVYQPFLAVFVRFTAFSTREVYTWVLLDCNTCVRHARRGTARQWVALVALLVVVVAVAVRERRVVRMADE